MGQSLGTNSLWAKRIKKMKYSSIKGRRRVSAGGEIASLACSISQWSATLRKLVSLDLHLNCMINGFSWFLWVLLSHPSYARCMSDYAKFSSSIRNVSEWLRMWRFTASLRNSLCHLWDFIATTFFSLSHHLTFFSEATEELSSISKSTHMYPGDLGLLFSLLLHLKQLLIDSFFSKVNTGEDFFFNLLSHLHT